MDGAHFLPPMLATLLASLVECIEALIVILAVGAALGWRGALAGTGAALGSLLAAVAVFGPLLALVPVQAIHLGVGLLLLVFGVRWLRKAVLRAAGLIPLRDEVAAYSWASGAGVSRRPTDREPPISLMGLYVDSHRLQTSNPCADRLDLAARGVDIETMARLRVLIAALLLVAFTLGVPSHAATTHGLAHAGGQAAAHVHDSHGKGKCCPDQKLCSHEVCQIACSAGLALLERPPELTTQFAYAVQFATGSPSPVREVVPTPDPFPPRPPRIA